jgi:hypothetical protein
MSWKKAIATAQLLFSVHSSATGSENEAAEYVKNVLNYRERQQLEERLKADRELDAAAWVRANS